MTLIVKTSSKCCNYRLFKEIFGIEEYLVKTPCKLLKFTFKFRTRNHRLSVETGSLYNIETTERKYTLCNSSTCDEFHYLLECTAFNSSRNKLLDNFFSPLSKPKCTLI